MQLFQAILLLAAGCLRRLLRRPMVLQAMVWPGLLATGALLLAIGLAVALRVPPSVAVAEPALADALTAAGLTAVADPDPETAVSSGRAVRAAWRAPDGVVLEINVRRTVVGGQPDDLAAEAALRELEGTGWRLEPTVMPARSSDFTRSVGWLAGLVAVLFTLYGALVGLGALASDRSEGVLEPELSLPVPSWAHPAARLLAAGVVLSASLAGTLAAMDALVGVAHVGRWWLHGSAAAVAAAGIGILVSPPGLTGGGGFSGPLSRALTICTGLLGLGASMPAIGAWVPIAAIGALAAGTEPVAAMLPLAVLPGVLGAWRFARGMAA